MARNSLNRPQTWRTWALELSYDSASLHNKFLIAWFLDLYWNISLSSRVHSSYSSLVARSVEYKHWYEHVNFPGLGCNSMVYPYICSISMGISSTTLQLWEYCCSYESSPLSIYYQHTLGLYCFFKVVTAKVSQINLVECNLQPEMV